VWFVAAILCAWIVPTTESQRVTEEGEERGEGGERREARYPYAGVRMGEGLSRPERRTP
jgi:hypothetical protein